MGRLFASIFLSIGLLLLAGAAYLYFDTRAWLARSVEAQGEVIELVATRGNDGNVLLAPKVRFETADGKTVEFLSALRTNPPSHAVGQRVRVLYDPARPSSASLTGFFALWFVALVLGFLGVVFTGVGVTAAIMLRRMARRT